MSDDFGAAMNRLSDAVEFGSQHVLSHQSVGVRDLHVVLQEVERLRRIEVAVKVACQHDCDCDEEGEGECCMKGWRRVAMLVGIARNLTADEESWLRDALTPSVEGGERG